MPTRRSFLTLFTQFAALAATFRRGATAQSGLFPHRAKAKKQAPAALVYFGTQTTAKGGSKGIYRARFDATKGLLTSPELAAGCVGPSFLASGQSGAHRLLYATNEGNAQQSGVTTFALDPASGVLTLLSQVPSAGLGPCYLSLAASGRSAYVANYGGGTVTGFTVKPDGTLTQPTESIDLRKMHKHGPDADRQDASHPHSATLSPDNAFLLVNDLGCDVIYIFPVDPATGHLGKPSVNEVRLPGSGPRHVAFHPNGRWVYGLDEMLNRLDHYLWNTVHTSNKQPEAALLTDAGHGVSTLPADYSGPRNTAAELAISPDGHFLYASNRGEDSLVLFEINQTTGALTFAQRIACGGRQPRHFALDPSGRWILCSNQGSGTVTVLSRDEGTGRLSGPVQTIVVPEALFALFV